MDRFLELLSLPLAGATLLRPGGDGALSGPTAFGVGEAHWPLLLWILLFPLAGSATVWFLTTRRKELHQLSGVIATTAALCSFVVSVVSFLFLRQLTTANLDAAFYYTLWSWIEVGGFKVDLAFRFDRLAAVMCLVITGIGSLIHMYAIGYMSHDESRPRFFCYLNLFLFAMLVLVLGSSLPVMFVGWEGVGLCSYLLIGFWFSEMPNARAGQKAFVVNRIGDAGFILGMFTLAMLTKGSLDFELLRRVFGSFADSGISIQLVELAALLLFVGAVGKSAQIPLFVWLPDAMAGPTPVSALIHAATMVTAGVYMIARLSFLYTVAPAALTVITVVGVATAFIAATIALVQNDIKKVLAYSTVSQLGFMFMAMGSGAFSNGIYHVVTHAFFKACLFMGAGSVIMGCHHEQDMRHYGGLWRKMPLTFATYLCATLAIAGIPFTSGFFSKDAILWTVYSSPFLGSVEVGGVMFELGHLLWAVGLVTAFLTAFYMTRSLVLTFLGEYRGHHHPHESPVVVTVPLLALAIPSLLFGLVFGEHLLDYLGQWTREDLVGGHAVLAHNHEYELLERISMVVAVLAVMLSVFVYWGKPAIAQSAARRAPVLYRFLLDKWRFDELFDLIIVRPLLGVSKLLFTFVDRLLVDGAVNGTGALVEAHGDLLRRVHTGRLGHYVLWMFAGNVIVVAVWVLFG